jgi:hypothetical protein
MEPTHYDLYCSCYEARCLTPHAERTSSITLDTASIIHGRICSRCAGLKDWFAF